MTKTKKKKTDFTQGKLFLPILLFTLPIMASGFLQLLYNMADQIIVGRFSGDPNALGAVGSTSSLTHLITNFLLGISTGTGVVVAQFFGAKQNEHISKAVHTSLTFSLIGGVVVGVFGILVAGPMLSWMDTKPDFLPSATLYMQIIFCGLPASAVYNFGAAVLRSMGNSRGPLIILSSAGLVNVVLNLFFVLVCHMSVAGVAYATIASQYFSAVAVVILLARADGPHRFSFRRIGIDWAMLKRVLRIGVPSALQGCLFSVSNVLIQSATNTFPPATVSAFAVGNTVEGLTYTAMNSFQQSVTTVIGQNYGARNRIRIRKALFYTLLQVTTVGLLVAAVEICFARELSMLFVDMSLEGAIDVVNAAVARLQILLSTYVLCGILEVLTGYLRGIGFSLIPMFSCVFGVCAIRVLWVLTVFPLLPTEWMLLLVYPISWCVTIVLHSITSVFAQRKMKKTFV